MLAEEINIINDGVNIKLCHAMGCSMTIVKPLVEHTCSYSCEVQHSSPVLGGDGECATSTVTSNGIRCGCVG